MLSKSLNVDGGRENNMDILFCTLFGVALGFIVGCACTTGDFTDRLIEAELAEFVVDSTTGDTTFIIYAEETNK